MSRLSERREQMRAARNAAKEEDAILSDSPGMDPADLPVGDETFEIEETVGEQAELSRGKVISIFVALMVAMFVGSLNQTVTATALPTIVGELNGIDMMLWVTTAYMLASTVMMPIYGKLSDMMGCKYLFLVCFALFLTGSFIGGWADSMEWLIFGRVIQGLGGGGQMILSQAIIADIFPPRERGKYMGMMGAVMGISMVVGPLIGGFFTEQLTWRWCFWMNVPLSLFAMLAVGILLPHRPHTPGAAKRYDYLGTIFMAGATVSLILTISWGGHTYEWGDPVIIGLIICCIICAVIFVLIELKAKDPLISMKFFKNRNFVICTIAGLLIMAGMMGTVSYIPTYFQIVTELSATAAGYMLLPMMLGMMLTSTVMGFIASKTGKVKWMPICSCIVAACAFFLLSTLAVDTSLWVCGIYLAMLGIGVGMGQQMLVLIVQNEFDVSIVGSVTAANNFFRQIGATIGASVVGTFFTTNLSDRLIENIQALGAQALASLQGMGASLNSITPSLVQELPDEVQYAIQLSYNEALTPVFASLIPLFVVGVIILLFLKNNELKSTNSPGGPGGMGGRGRGNKDGKPSRGPRGRRSKNAEAEAAMMEGFPIDDNLNVAVLNGGSIRSLQQPA